MTFEHVDAARYLLPAGLEPRLLTPALVVWMDAVRANLAAMRAHLGGDMDRWRPHVKTTKLPPVWRELQAAGVRAFKCATTREAGELLGALGDVDLLVAYPHVAPALARLGALADAHPGATLSVLVEDEAAVADVPRSLGVFVDVNPGMDRTGVPEGADDVVLAIARAAGERFRGVHHYEGHLHDPDLDARRAACFAGYTVLLARLDALASQGTPAREVVTSGTPGFRFALEFEPFGRLRAARHRVSPGTVVFHDARSERDGPGLGLVPAATVLARVVSRPAASIVTCDAGSKSIAAEAGHPCAFPLGRTDLVARVPNEEHLPFDVTGEPPPRGTTLLLVPEHVCPTVNLAEQALLVDGDAWRVADVSARAHDLLVEPAP